MIDINRITNEYDRLKREGRGNRLLPLDKILKIEQSKDDLIDIYLSKIKGITKDFKVVYDDKEMTLSSQEKFCSNRFGTLNFTDKAIENGKIKMVYAYNFCLITIECSSYVTYKVNVFWDL